MLKFFRRLRQSLIESGHVRKYFLYAIGEIALVVIGILIALQINNWNANKKARANEEYILTELESNLIEEGNQVDEMVMRRTRAYNAIDRLASLLFDEEIGLDSLEVYTAQMMTFERFFPIRNAYEVSKANGLQITNKGLRTQIAKYYEFEQSKVQKSIQDIERVFVKSFEPILGSTKIVNGQYGVFVKFADPNDVELFQNIYEAAYFFKWNHRSSFENIKLFKEKNADLLRKVEGELKEF